MGTFVYANSFRVHSSDTEVAIEFQTVFPVSDGEKITGVDNIGEAVRVIVPSALVGNLISGLNARNNQNAEG